MSFLSMMLNQRSVAEFLLLGVTDGQEHKSVMGRKAKHCLVARRFRYAHMKTGGELLGSRGDQQEAGGKDRWRVGV